MSESNTRTWVDLEAIAAHLGTTPRHVKIMVKRGDIPAHRLGPRLLRFDLHEVDEAVAST